ncbi:MAG: hypothetical protein MJ245_06080 [Clostridia bacterium]|nr:hypothetical protein [Clostridia bacterium]
MSSEWLDSFMKTAGDVAKKTSREANCLYNVKKTELEIAKINHEIGKIYKAIGETVYNAHEEETDSSNIDILCKQIDVKKAYIAELNKRIELYKEEKDLEKKEFINLNETPKFMDKDED